MAWIVRSVLALGIGLALAAPAYALDGRTFTCTNIMGGNPFAMVLGADRYTVQSEPQSRTQISGEGTLINDPERTYLMVGSGPLKDEWQIENIYQFDGSNLSLSGAEGLMQCKKSKPKP